MSFAPKVLVVDDDESTHRLVERYLQCLGPKVIHALKGDDGLVAAREHRPNLILLDVHMPAMDGFSVRRFLLDDWRTEDIPVIMMTSSMDPQTRIKAFEIGAVDYVTKPFHSAELCARVGSVLKTQALVAELESQAHTDSLTGLPNRAAFSRALTHCIDRTRRSREYKFGVLFMDLDRFKLVNDTLGHDVGDQLLIAIAQKLRHCLRSAARDGEVESGDMVARMGGDEFTILLDDIPDLRIPTIVAERLLEELSRPLEVAGHELLTGASVGIRLCDRQCISADALLRDSDIAMYRAKAEGRGRFVIFDDRMHQEVLDAVRLENDLRQAVQSDEFVLHYQPIIALESGRLLGFESLLRWRHPQRGLLKPQRFIGVAEETGLIMDVSRCVLLEACTRLRQWQRESTSLVPLTMNVNLSKKQLCHPKILDDVDAVLEETGIEPVTLHIEVTESVVMHDRRRVVPVLEKLRRRGVKLAMDDFGTGYSSLASLHRFPIDVLKIDRSFIDSIAQNRAYAAIVQAIVTLAQNLNMQVVAEGIETQDQLSQLQALDCDAAQGFFIARPLDAEQALGWVRSGGGLRCPVAAAAVE